MNKQFIIILVACFAIFGGILYSQKQSSDEATVDTSSVQDTYTYGVNPDEAEDPESVVNLTEYADFQCPACASYHPIVSQLKEKYKDKITFQFKNFPLTAIHPNAMAAHRAAVAAGNQDKFWEMHDLLYQRQQAWAESNNPVEVFRGYAEEIQLDMAKYDTDLASRETNAVIQSDLKEGQDLNVQGTPGFVLDGKLIENPKSIEEFDQLIQDAIKEKATS